MKTALLIDGSNVYATSKALGFDFDYKKILDMFQGHNVQPYYFTALPPEGVHSDLRKLADWLQYNGYNLVTKRLKSWIQSDGSMKRKGNMDIEIAIYALRLAEYVDHIALWSGDGDFTSLVEECKNKGVIVSVYSSLKAEMVADELRRAANKFFELDDLRDRIAIGPSSSKNKFSINRR